MTKHYEQRKKANEKYLAGMERITIRVPKEKGLKEMLQIAAQAKGISVNAYIHMAIQRQLIFDGFYRYGEPLQEE